MEESIAGAELQSEAAGQIASAAAKLDIPTIIQVMNAHLDVSRVQSCASQALADLADENEVKDKIVAAGGLEAICRALHRHRSVAETQVM